MSTKKTIQINPELFKMGGNKTKKNKERKNLTLNPIISPNNLKNKLLKRIKEHKTQEFKIQEIQNQEFKNGKKTPEIESQSSNPSTYTDEFYGALDYLSDLSKKQKSDAVKHRSLNTKTLKNLYTDNSNALSNNPTNNPTNTNISLELPPELQETNTFIPQTNEIFNVNYKKVEDVPYGCLKNGKKKTYREWKEINNNNNNNGNIDVHDIVRPPTPPKKNVPVQKLSREEHLEKIKNKLKQIQNQENLLKQETNLLKQETNLGISSLEDFSNDDIDIKDINQIIKEKEPTKTYFKQTLKTKITLGKSDKLRRVSVLIKDNETRKNIINTQKKLKKTSITDVRKYLRQHGIIKVGSTCPSDILRKAFESAVLTGEITNTNKDTLLHNFLSSEIEE
jgi:hypothetical protein